MTFKSNGKIKTLTLDNSTYVYSSEMNAIKFDSQNYSVVKDNSRHSENENTDLEKAIEMIFLFKNLRENVIFDD